jgi:hypothetical protein
MYRKIPWELVADPLGHTSPLKKKKNNKKKKKKKKQKNIRT